MIEITYESALAALRKQVELKGADYVYPYDECFYQSKGEPLCIVGCALVDLGVSVVTLIKLDDDGAPLAIDGDRALKKLTEEGISLDPQALTLFMIAQQAQDTQDSWGRAVERAIDYTERRNQ